MMLAAVYLQPSDAPLISGSVFEKIANDDRVAVAAPLGFGDSFRGHPVVGTTPEFLSYLSENQIAGRVFGGLFEAVIGAAVPLAPGDHFEPAHGMIAPDDAGDDHAAHDGADFAVVGPMAPTGTPWDKAIIVPIEAVWAVPGLANGHAPERADQIGPPFDADYFPGTPAVIVHAEQLWANYALRSEFTRAGETMAFFPGAVLAQLYSVMGDVRQVMSIMSLVTQVLVAASVLLGLLILVLLLRRQLALLRALGAPTRFVFAVVWSYAAVLLGAGALAGLVVGQLATVVLSRIVTARTDIAVSAPLGWPEYHLVAGFVCLAALLALIPAWAVLRSPVVDGLRA